MSLSLEQKKAVVSEVSGALASAQTAVLAEYRGLTVAQLTDLRREARNAGVFVRVVKNTLAKRAIEGSDFECLSKHLVGPILFSASEDPVAAAKLISRFAKEYGDLEITAGAMNGNLLDLEGIQALAKLPGREELLAKLAGTMQAPIQKFVQTLNEVPGKFVRVLAAVAESKEKEAA